MKNDNDSYEGQKRIVIENIIILFWSFFYGFYKYFSFKIFEVLTPLHKIFYYSIYYFFFEFIFLCIRGYNMFTDNKNNNFLISKLFITLISDILSIFGYLLYIEIIELNIKGFNYNLKKNIMTRGDKDIIKLDLDDFLDIGNESSQDEQSVSNYPESKLYD